GTGKTSLAYAVAYELGLGEVLHWPITTRTTLKDGLYSYDAIGRLQDAKDKDKDNLAEIGKYINLGSLGTALLPSEKPRVLLIDEIDKSDIDLPNDLLHIFEEGEFEIPVLRRIDDKIAQVEVQTADK
ncbi:MAG: MoxR family ATPase, partial [Dolichospermum sp.]